MITKCYALLATLLLSATLFTAASLRAQTAATTPVSRTRIPQGRRADAWWQHAVVYEVYGRSFGDSNGDGTGDLNGITEHLDYLQRLGVDAIWLAPIYPSPQVDFGYDISDGKAVDPQYGTLADFDRLLALAKKHGIRIVLDMVLNHTSDKSAWFIESSSSRTNSRNDWYVWSDGIPASSANLAKVQKDVHEGLKGPVVPPNNWESTWGGSAWTWVPARQQFYYHKFYKEQPDLNWRNPDVENAMFDVMRFWLDRGVAGFRLDAIQTLFEDSQLRSIPDGADLMGSGYTANLPQVHGVLKRVRAMVNAYGDQRVLIGEILEPAMDKLDAWYGGAAQDELQLPMDYFFGFPHLVTGDFMARSDKLNVDFYRKQLLGMSTQLHGSRSFIFLDNHDNVRSIDRFGDGEHNVQIARLTAALLLTAPGTAQTYYGSEIGMVTTTPTRREDVRDPVGRSQWPQNKGRDGERTPMQWTPGPQAGFSSNPTTWLPIPPSYTVTNVQTEEKQPDSLLAWYKSLIVLRRTTPAMRDGGVSIIDEKNTNVLSFVRTSPNGFKSVLVMLNMTGTPQTASLALDAWRPGEQSRLRTLLVSPGQQLPSSSNSVKLAPFAVFIAEVR